MGDTPSGRPAVDAAHGALPARYVRQILFEGIGADGQAGIMASRVVLAGCGALGCMQATLVVRAGFGTVRVIDRDFVEEGNLHRQTLFDEEDARTFQPKAEAAAAKLRRANSLVAVEGVVDDINPRSIDRLLGGFDLILDATDNFDARFLVNDYAVKTGTPWIYGACVGSYGLTFPIIPGETPCLRCVFESPPAPGLSPTCDTAGVLGSVVGVVASLQVVEAVKIAAGRRDAVNRKMTAVDLWDNSIQAFDLPARDPDCPCCGQRRFDYLDGGEASETTSLCGRDSVQVDRRDRLTVFPDGRAIIGGTNDPAIAKSVYSRFIGT